MLTLPVNRGMGLNIIPAAAARAQCRAINNLLPHRIFSVITASGWHYWVVVAMGYVAVLSVAIAGLLVRGWMLIKRGDGFRHGASRHKQFLSTRGERIARGQTVEQAQSQTLLEGVHDARVAHRPGADPGGAQRAGG